jgi:hypothetical protein
LGINADTTLSYARLAVHPTGAAKNSGNPLFTRVNPCSSVAQLLFSGLSIIDPFGKKWIAILSIRGWYKIRIIGIIARIPEIISLVIIELLSVYRIRTTSRVRAVNSVRIGYIAWAVWNMWVIRGIDRIRSVRVNIGSVWVWGAVWRVWTAIATRNTG